MSRFITVSLSSILCMSMGLVFAERSGDRPGDRSVEQRLFTLEKEMDQIRVKNEGGTAGATFASPGDPMSYGWVFDGEVLLWHAKAGAVDWSITYDEAIYPVAGSMRTLSFGWDWGLRVGLSKHLPHDGWDLGFLYTYFSTDDSSSVNIGFQTAEDVGAFGTSKGSFSAKYVYNSIDLAIGKPFFLSSTLKVQPHLGLKSIWLGQKYKLYSENYINALTTSLAVEGQVNTFLKDVSHVWGIGPHVGLDSEAICRNGIKFISSMEAALLQSYLKVVQRQTLFLAPEGSTPVNTTMKLSGPLHGFVPYARLLLGLGWCGYVNDKEQRVDLSLNYEINYFWRVNQTLDDENTDPASPDFSSTQPVRIYIQRYAEDISFYGVTARIKIDF